MPQLAARHSTEPRRTTADTDMLLTSAAPHQVPEPDAYSIPGFCKQHDISEPTYYKERRAGRGPVEMRIGAVVRISREAAADWRRARENPTGEEAAVVARQAESLRERARRASRNSIASPLHVSNAGPGRPSVKSRRGD